MGPALGCGKTQGGDGGRGVHLDDDQETIVHGATGSKRRGRLGYETRAWSISEGRRRDSHHPPWTMEILLWARRTRLLLSSIAFTSGVLSYLMAFCSVLRIFSDMSHHSHSVRTRTALSVPFFVAQCTCEKACGGVDQQALYGLRREISRCLSNGCITQLWYQLIGNSGVARIGNGCN